VTPEDLLYDETHEWVRLENEAGQKMATVGITDFAVEQLTDLVYLDLPEVGSQVTAGEEFGEVESVKAVSPLYSPVTGEVVAVHSELCDNPKTLSQDPYGEGWLIKVRVTDETSLSRLLDAAAYQKQREGEA